MSDSSRGAEPSQPASEKKQPETVLLTAEELKKIAGGALGTPGQPPVASGVVSTNRTSGTSTLPQ